MPRKKISIEEAFSALEAAGIHVQVKKVDEVTQPIPVNRVTDATQFPAVPVIQKVGPINVKIALYARHTVGSGGYTVIVEDGSEQIQSAGVESYGPGYCIVPSQLAEHLLYQDALARQADANMLDRTHKCYVVGEVVGVNGIRSNIGVQLDQMTFDDVGKWPAIVLKGG